MEHAKITEKATRLYHIEADKGYVLESKTTGRQFKVIDTADTKRWRCVKESAAKKKGGKPKTRK